MLFKKNDSDKLQGKENKLLSKYGFVRSPYLQMTVHDDSDFLSPYSETDVPVISTEVAEFLDESAMAFHHSEKLVLEIKSDCIDDEEKKIYPKAIRNYYTLRQVACARDLKRNSFVSLIMTLIGVFSLAGMFLLDHFGIRDIWVECIDIFAWVFLWEAVDQYFIERRVLKIKHKRNKAFMEMEVKFTDLTKKDL